MADAAPPKKSGPGRWILLGCGLLTGLLILGFGGCAGIFYLIYRGTDSVAAVGAAYLQEHSGVRSAFGGELVARRSWNGWNVRTSNGKGSARMSYNLQGVGTGRKGKALVGMIRDDGRWSVSGAVVQAGGDKPLTFGSTPGERSQIDWD